MEQAPRNTNTETPEVPNYRLLRRIGSGSFGDVWLAEAETRHLCAIKIISRCTYESDAHFQREFQSLQQYEKVSRGHGGLVDILHVGRDPRGQYYYYVMELADDVGTAHQLVPDHYTPCTLKPGVLLPVGQCIEVGLIIADALDYLHRAGLVHRDVKLSNILFFRGKPKLGDISLVDPIGSDRAGAGTRGYVPLDCPGTPMADVYALGKVLYEINTGQDRLAFPQLPTGVENDPDLRQRLLVNDVILTACHSYPRRRYQTAGHLLAALQNLSGRLDAGRERPRSPATRIGLAAAAACGLLVLTAAAIALTAHRVPAMPGFLSTRVEPAAADWKGADLEVRSKFHPLWAQKFSGDICNAAVADLDGDGRQEVIVGIGGRAIDAGQLIAFDKDGDRKWQFQPDARFHYPGGRSGRLTAGFFALLPEAGGGRGRGVVAAYRDSQDWYQSCLFTLDGRLRETGRYWHPGHLHHVIVDAPSPQARSKIVASGVNNDLSPQFPGEGYIPCMFMLDPERVAGEAPPRHGDGSKGSEEWYGVILPKNEIITRLEVVDRSGDHRNEICAWTVHGHIFYVGFDGALHSQARSDGATGEAEYRRIQ